MEECYKMLQLYKGKMQQNALIKDFQDSDEFVELNMAFKGTSKALGDETEATNNTDRLAFTAAA